MPIDRPDWTLPPAPPSPAAQDMMPVRTNEPDDGDSALHRQLLAEGIFTREELAEHYSLSADEIAALDQAPKLSRAKIDAELSEIAKRRREDRRAYFKDEALQARERELLTARSQLGAGDKDEAASGDGSGLDPDLLAEWAKTAGIAHCLAVARGSAKAALEPLEEADRAALQSGFDSLPGSAQAQIIRYLALEPGGSARPASDAALKEFATLPEGADLVKEWGPRAARNLGVARARMDLMLRGMSGTQQKETTDWFDALPPAQAKAVIKALAGQ